jgi:hypothetical protein
MDIYSAATQFSRWMDAQILSCARGDDLWELSVEPGGRFWLGRLASEESVAESALGERGERLEPCAVGLRLRPRGQPPWRFRVRVRVCAWVLSDKIWRKSPHVEHLLEILAERSYTTARAFGADELGSALTAATGRAGLCCEIRVEVSERAGLGPELAVLLVNTSPKEHANFRDTRLYECSLEVNGIHIVPFILESLPDSFRYDRRVQAYGINCGVDLPQPGVICTTDTVTVEKVRPSYWNHEAQEPDLTFGTLSRDPLPSLKELARCHREWGRKAWSLAAIQKRAAGGSWSSEMVAEAQIASAEFRVESERLGKGIELLESDPQLLHAFQLMNTAASHAANGRYTSWRPFQAGFLIANMASIALNREGADVVDVVWFATGGGKTETYLGLLVTAALYDRMTGKTTGITAWSRFPLRMLSLQQTQRFADAMAGAELARLEAGIRGAPFSVGFLVGEGATPNSLKEESGPGEPDIEDDEMPARYRVLLTCPFCHEDGVVMGFDRRLWRLEHRCSSKACPWGGKALPFYIVDEEIYRFLPTIVVGTLDKAASIAIQAGMRGLIGGPIGLCSETGHGYTYAPRSKRPNGCMVPGCRGKSQPLPMGADRYAPSFRLQDELHLLRDSLGAVDSHYESLLDHLELVTSGRTGKILASSATLTGHDRQIRLLYQRKARVFPVPGPSVSEGFWTSQGAGLARRYIAIAPRGVTIEYAVDRTITELQRIIRSLYSDPGPTCRSAGVDPRFAMELISLYGVDVIYGNTLRDLDAVTRSFETQIDVDGPVNTASLTGRTQFEDVRRTLDRLENPESDFGDRLHIVSASSMMSHGVDIGRLNVMVMLGIPLTAAEFIQTTARIGRNWPGTVYVMHKMARERDAGIFRCFDKFVQQGDRFVEPIQLRVQAGEF